MRHRRRTAALPRLGGGQGIAADRRVRIVESAAADERVRAARAFVEGHGAAAEIHLCRYLLRPPLALERLTESSGGAAPL